MYGEDKEKVLYPIVRSYIKHDVENKIENIKHIPENGLIVSDEYFILDFKHDDIREIRVYVDKSNSNVNKYTLCSVNRKTVVQSDLDQLIDKIIDFIMDNTYKSKLYILMEIFKYYSFCKLFTVPNNIYYLTSENELCLKGTIQNYLQGIRFEDLQDEYNFEMIATVAGVDVVFMYKLYSVNDVNKTIVVSDKVGRIPMDACVKVTSYNIFVYSPKEKKNILVNNSLIRIEDYLIKEYDRHSEYLLNDLIYKLEGIKKTKGEKK